MTHRAMVRPRPADRWRMVQLTDGRARYKSLSHGGLAAVLVAAALAPFTANPLLTLAAVLTFPVLFTLLWREGEPPILLLAVMFQWIQVTTKLFYADVIGIAVSEVPIDTLGAPYGTHLYMDDAILLALAGLIALSAGIRLGFPRTTVLPTHWRLRSLADLPVKRLWLLYLATFAFVAGTGAAIGLIPGLRQPLLALAALKWAVVFVFAYAVFTRRTGYGYLALVMAIEIVLGISGFFSEFRINFYVVIVAFLTAQPKVTRRQALVGATLALPFLLLAVIWSHVKVDYREYISAGTGQQVVAVPLAQRLATLPGMILEMDGAAYADGGEKLVQRLGYVDMLAMTLLRVPATVPHEGGRLSWNAITHFLKPRVFFPDKPVLSDSATATKYAGVRIHGATSISLGYMAELYIDFGLPYLYLGLLVMGYVFGRVYGVFLSLPLGVPDRFGLLVVLFLPFMLFETALPKLIGALMISGVVAYAAARTILPAMPTWLTLRKGKRSTAPTRRRSVG